MNYKMLKKLGMGVLLVCVGLFSAMKMKSDDVYVAREPASFLCSITKMGYFLFLRNGDYFSHFLYICAIIYIKF